jgi:hypothetical protein
MHSHLQLLQQLPVSWWGHTGQVSQLTAAGIVTSERYEREHKQQTR